MNQPRSAENQEKINFLLNVLNENKGQSKKDNPIYYSIFLIRFGSKVPVISKEPATTDIKAQIEKYSAPDRFNPDQLVVELFTARSKNVKKPFATYKFVYRTNGRT
jgi:hypothetical protein